MAEKIIPINVFNRIFDDCRNFDPFTIYIDNGRQRESAERQNDKIEANINESLAEYDLEMKSIPWGVDVSNKREDARKALIEWFNKNGYEVEKASAKRIWTEEEIKNLIQTNDKVLYGALKRLYSCQTEEEQTDGQTREYNGAGFNGVDSKFLSSVSEFLIKRGYLTDKQKAATRKLLVKYNKQLTRLSNM